MTDDTPHPTDEPATGVDWGLVLVGMVFLAIPIAIWLLLAGGGSDGTTGTGERPTPPAADAPAEAGEPGAPMRSKRRVRPGEIVRLERELEAAQAALEQARIERVQSPSGTWDEIIRERQQEIAELREKIEKARGR